MRSARVAVIAAMFVLAETATIVRAGTPNTDVVITAVLPRGTEPKTITIDVNLKKMPVTDAVLPDDAKGTIQKRLKFFLKDATSANRIKFQGETTTDPTAPGYDMGINAATLEKVTVGTEVTITVKATLTLNSGNVIKDPVLKQESGKGVVNLKVTYTAENKDTKDVEIKALQQTGVPKAAPDEFAVTAQHRGLAFSWSVPEKVAFTDGTQAAVSGTSLIVINIGAGESRSLPATKFNTDKTLEKASPCIFNYNGTGTEKTCEVICEDEVYLNTVGDDLTLRPDLQVLKSAGSGKAAAINELDPELAFAAIAQFEPEGIGRTSCIVRHAKETKTLTELNGAKDAKPGNPNCFIATAAYGTPLAEELDGLRWFRDNVMMRFTTGRGLIMLYYAYAPDAAAAIAERPAARAAVRGILAAPVWVFGALAVGDSKPLIVLVACLMVALGGTVVLVARRSQWR